MKRKVAGCIVRLRKVILILGIAGAAVCLFTAGQTRINYDMTRYLDPNTLTQRSLAVMQEEFGSAEQMRLMFHDLDAEALEENVRRLEAMPQVHLAAHNPDTDVKVLDGVTYQVVLVTLRECDAPALVEEMQELFPDCFIDGSAAIQLQVQEAVGAEMPMVMLVAVAVVIGVLLLTSHSWLEPLVILPVLAVSILINMGTNFIFADISFIAFAVSAILQLALSIDYAIMLLHAYNDRRGRGMEPEAAMTDALTESMMPIASSALTTVAGLMSLLFMSFTIGFDIGMVLSKGILLSMVTVFLLMPAVTLLCSGLLQKTRHRPLRLGGEKLGGITYRLRKPLAVLIAAAACAGFILQSGNSYIMSDPTQDFLHGKDQEISRVFGANNPLVLLVPGGDEDADYGRQRELAGRLQAIRIDGEEAVLSISAMVTTGAQALEYYSAADVAKLTGMSSFAVNVFFASQGLPSSVRADKLLDAAGNLFPGNGQISQLQSALKTVRAAFNSPHYARMLLNMRFQSDSKESMRAIEEIMAIARDMYGEDFYLTGFPMSTYDISRAFNDDLTRVNLITFLAILLIVTVSFRSFLLPLLLVLVIEGAIWITMAVSRVLGQPIFFMSYLVCISLQMGATIDYGILLSSHYRRARREGVQVSEALRGALKRALPTVLTSGVILMTAGYIIGKICSVYYISDIGLLLARGTLISVLMVLILLPAVLAVCDRFAVKEKGTRADQS